jgi:3'-phosphoadenosine 5'-phosphosulfate sulfotransferase (PAPS reductase)/FAD synthetase
MPFKVKSDYVLWKKEQEPILTTLRGKEVWVLFSGGKDSSLALYFVHAASEEFGFSLQVHVGTFPKHRYTPREMDRIDLLCGSPTIVWKGMIIHVLRVNRRASDGYTNTLEADASI